VSGSALGASPPAGTDPLELRFRVLIWSEEVQLITLAISSRRGPFDEGRCPVVLSGNPDGVDHAAAPRMGASITQAIADWAVDLPGGDACALASARTNTTIPRRIAAAGWLIQAAPRPAPAARRRALLAARGRARLPGRRPGPGRGGQTRRNTA